MVCVEWRFIFRVLVFLENSKLQQMAKSSDRTSDLTVSFQVLICNAGCSLNCLCMTPQIYLSFSEDVNFKQFSCIYSFIAD